MNDQEFENIIRKILKKEALPDRASLIYTLSHIEDTTGVTESAEVRYNRKTASPLNIINNKIADFIAVFRTKRMVLVPSLILLLFIGAFSLSTHTASSNNKSIEQLAEQNEAIEEPGVLDDDNPAALTSFDESAIDNLGVIPNEL